MKYLIFLLLLQLACSPKNDTVVSAYTKQAERVSIIRDGWGVPHVYGKTDADAVFGMMYAQCEDNFESVERNYIERFGRLAEIEGEPYLYADLQMRLIYDTSAAIADYQKSPAWLKELLQAFADGINYYIYLHPDKPVLLSHFEPWYPLMFTDGGYTATQTADISKEDVEGLYNPTANTGAYLKKKSIPIAVTGSNGFAISPAKSATKNALLYINPHVSFYFRTEMHVVSEQGLNAYGAVTWGQFFVFQGFNESCGWMHTSSMADAADVYEEKVNKQGADFTYEYDGAMKKVQTRQHTINYLKEGSIQSNNITAYYTHHGPVMGKRNDKWLSLKERNRSLNGLIQSWQRTKAKDLPEFKQTLALQSNNSTNTLYADKGGNIAYWHGNFIPVRDTQFNWSLPVDGSIAATEWKGFHSIDEIIHVTNPKPGFLQNCNSTPFTAAGMASLSGKSYPAYMAPDGENFRSLLAIKELEKESGFTAEKLIAVGYNHYLPAFDSLLPPLFRAYDALPATDSMRAILSEPIALLKAWDRKSAIASIATTIAIEWGLTLLQYGYENRVEDPKENQVKLYAAFAKKTPPARLLSMLNNVVGGLNNYYGNWKKPWGEINRYQRNEGSIHQKFDDNKMSLPVGMASSIFGSLPAFETTWAGTRKGYGYAGNSFVAVVEFGPRIKAKSITTGGQSFNADSKNFNDQADGFINGKFKEVLFYKEDVLKGAKSNYHPGA